MQRKPRLVEVVAPQEEVGQIKRTMLPSLARRLGVSWRLIRFRTCPRGERRVTIRVDGTVEANIKIRFKLTLSQLEVVLREGLLNGMHPVIVLQDKARTARSRVSERRPQYVNASRARMRM